jgi:hypothetical protein
MKKIAIKKLLVAVAIATATNISFAQTPYDSFAPSSEKKEMLKLPETTFRAYNTDTTSESRYIELDKEMYTISYFNENDSLLKTVQLEPTAMKWYSVDPHASNYPEASPYNFVNNNPIWNIDPDGRDWFKYQKDGSDEATWNWHDGSTYEHKTGVDADGNDIFETLQGHKAVVVFNGSVNEKLGKGQNLKGEGAVLASVTVYGPGGADDVQNYQGYTMSSDPTKFGVVKSGEYTVNRIGPNDRKGPYNSEWTLNNRGKVPDDDNYNPNFPNRNPAYLDGVFIHRSNNNGWAGYKWNEQKKDWSAVSKGCLLILPDQWSVFNQQLESVNEFHLILNR